MNNTVKRIEGAAEQVGGTIKKGVGKLIHDPKMEDAGRTEEQAGEDKQEAAKAAEHVKGSVEEAAGAIEHGAGKVLGDKKMAARGTAKELKGKARQKVN